MDVPARPWCAMALIAGLVGYSELRADTAEPVALIGPDDPRFSVLELPNAAHDAASGGIHGTVLLSFVSNDARYCRAARFPSEYSVLLACREQGGWKIEATSNIAPAEAANPTAFGGSPMREVSAAVEALRASPDFLDEREVEEAAARSWLDPVPVAEQSFDARDILRRTAGVYKASKSYVDEGTVQTVYPSQSGGRIVETHFKTAYVAPFDFRFESNMGDFGSIDVGYIAWMDQNGVETWFSIKPDRGRVIATIQDAIDEAAGISRDSSGMIPGLIFPGSRLGGDIVRLTDAVRLEDAQVDGFDCFQVQGFRWPNTGQPTTVWIDKESFLIRRVYEEKTIRGDTIKTTWIYQPSLNVPVDAELLRFNKPVPE